MESRTVSLRVRRLRMLPAKLTTALVIATAVWPSAAYAFTYPYTPVSPTAVHDAEASPQVDLRSPDARDAARKAAATAAEATGAPPSRSTPNVSEGFEWSDAGIGAAVMLALVSVASGTLLLVGRNRRRSTTA
jgi:hypothetical protein